MERYSVELIVCGFVRENWIKWMYHDIIKIITQFCELNIPCKLYEKRKGIHNNERIIKIYINCRKYIGINDKYQLCLHWGLSTKIENPGLIGKNTKINIVSRGMATNHFYIYTSDNKLYGFSYYKTKDVLGIGDQKQYNKSRNKYILMDTSIMKSNIIQINCGTKHSLFLTQFGKVYGSGNNKYLQLTDQFNQKNIVSLKKINKLHNIIKIGCGSYTSYALNRYSKLYSFGSNACGKLGIGNEYDYRFKSGILNRIKIDNIISFDAIHGHCGIITHNNEAYLWGDNGFDQCGTTIQKEIGIPIKLMFNDDITNVKCGYCHTIIRSINNEYYSFGYNEGWCLLRDIIGTHDGIPGLIDMKSIEINGDIIDVIPGYHTTYILQKI